jgi:AcrR family transcriptional regulator
MGISERKEREKNERKALIMHCARDLILELGVEKVSMMDIAQRAELSKATLYLYFPGKEELFAELCDEAGWDFVEYIRSRLRPGLSALESLRILWVSYLEMFGVSEDLMILMCNSIRNYLNAAFPLIDEKPEVPASILYSILKGILEQGIGEGVFEPSINPGMLSRTIIVLFSYVIDNAARILPELRKTQGINHEMKTIFEIILRGIAREGLEHSRLILPEQQRRAESAVDLALD